MFLYNITIGIDKNAEEEWLQWMQDVMIPLIMETGYFKEAKTFKVLHDQSEETTSYSFQFFAPSIKHVVTYLDIEAPAIMKELQSRYRDRHVAFQTLLEEI
jgi:hypothetical protein